MLDLLQGKPFAEIKPSNIRVQDEFIGHAAAKYSALCHYVSAVRNPECLPDVMISDQYPDPLPSQVKDYLPNIVDGDRVDPRERLIEQDIPRRRCEAPGDLNTPTLSAG